MKNVFEIPLGEGLPAWPAAGEYRVASARSETGYPALLYVSDDENAPDLRLTRRQKEAGETLESAGEKLAGEKKVYCNMTSRMGAPTAELTFFEASGGAEYVVSAYVFEGENELVTLSELRKTTRVPLVGTGLTMCLMNGFSASENRAGLFPEELVYTYGDPFLPTVRIRRFAKTDFPETSYDPALTPKTTRGEFAELARGGWEREDIVALYMREHDLSRHEVFRRNGLDAAFVGFTEEGVFTVRAYLALGESYVGICAENDAPRFRHVISALIDSVRKG